jgi:hypothetical protein
LHLTIREALDGRRYYQLEKETSGNTALWYAAAGAHALISRWSFAYHPFFDMVVRGKAIQYESTSATPPR